MHHFRLFRPSTSVTSPSEEPGWLAGKTVSLTAALLYKRITGNIILGNQRQIFELTTINQSIIPLACKECGDSLPFSGASSIPPCHTLFPTTPLRRPFFNPPLLHPAIYFLVYLLVL